MPSLDGVSGRVSFESKTSPGNYVRHKGFRLIVEPFHDTHIASASFIPKTGDCGVGSVIYEASNYPDQYIKYDGFGAVLKITKIVKNPKDHCSQIAFSLTDDDQIGAYLS